MMAQQQAAQDPVMQLQMRDIAIKEKEVARKEKKDLIDAAAKADAQKLKEAEASSRMQLDAIKTLLQAAKEQDMLTQEQQLEMMRLAVDMAKAEDSNANQREEGEKQRTHDMRKHSGEMVDRAVSRGQDMEKHQSSLADRAEDRKSKAEQAKASAKAKTAKKGDK